ncbi:MAG TPA: glutaredoxin family protein [Candidatus Methanofastidiosa archaeon]|nr:glutaredoxin family protein [Candidatus Methanofastidiosa archaeon]
MDIQHVGGKNMGDVLLYALSTCGWCRKTRELIESLGAEYRYVYVDLLEKEDMDEAVELIKELNPALSFPTAVINGVVIVGFREEEIRKALKGD